MRAKAYIVHRAMCEPELEWSKPKDCLSAEPLYAKREWQGLTQEDIFGIADKCGLASVDWTDVMHAVEAKLKEKNG